MGSETTGTLLYGRTPPVWVVITVLPLPAFGGPIPAIVVAFGLDERTVAAWHTTAGTHAPHPGNAGLRRAGRSPPSLFVASVDEEGEPHRYGTAHLDGEGRAWVDLPAWFTAATVVEGWAALSA